MSQKNDAEYLLLRARQPTQVTATAQVYAVGQRGLVSNMTLVAAAANATAVVRDGNAGGTIVWSLSVLANQARPCQFPSGLLFQNGLHVTLTGASAVLNIVGVDDAPEA